MSQPVVIVGAGVAGLRCAQLLAQAAVDYVLLEKSDGVGGRVRTDVVDGFRLDRGFQVFQTAYPEAQTALDYSGLDLQPLEPGALIFTDGKWVRMSDPWRRPQHALSTLLNPIGTPMDRWRLLRLRAACTSGEATSKPPVDDVSTRSLLTDEYQFSSDFINRFMQPWLSGIFLEKQLSTSASFFRFVFRMLSGGDICYPARGIQAIPEQMLASLDPARVQLNVPVRSVEGNRVLADDGRVFEGSTIVLAVDLEAARRLLPNMGGADSRGFTATRCTYFAAEKAPVAEATLLLNGTGTGPVNHVFVMSNASRHVAPDGQVLISASSVGQEALGEVERSAVMEQMKQWFGAEVLQWKELATYTLPTALPAQPAGFARQRPASQSPNIVLCGDYCETASLNGALRSGRLAAEQVLARAAA